MQRVDAIYARQSVDREDSISIESQVEFCRYEVRDHPFEVFCDRGYSGKNTQRPEFQRMLDAIRQDKVRRVICYKLDRCSRSLLDFAGMMEEFHRWGVEFVSCTEKFDTATPMGRAMLSICIVFAQLERETIQQRVSDAYRSRSLRGYYKGGRLPYGFFLEDCTLQGRKTSRYVPRPEEAEVVKIIYSLYAGPQVSLADVAAYLSANHMPNRRRPDGSWPRSLLSGILKNPIYVRADMEVYLFYQNRGTLIPEDPARFDGIHGCYLFSEHPEDPREYLVLAPHEGIVPADTWLRCQRKFHRDPRAGKPVKAANTWLAGKVKCPLCGYALVIRRSGQKRYYMCSQRLRAIGSCSGVGGLSAEELEAAVLRAITQQIRPLLPLRGRDTGPEDPEARKLKCRIARYRSEADRLLRDMRTSDKQASRLVGAELKRLEDAIGRNEAALLRLEGRPRQGPGIADPMAYWEKLTLPDKMTVVDALIDTIHADKERVAIRWKL